MALTISAAMPSDAAALAAIHSRAAEALTRAHGPGRWTTPNSERAVARAIAEGTVLIGRVEAVLVGTFRLTKRKPWAIDPTYFTPVTRPLYLLDMAVDPAYQRRGIGRLLLQRATAIAASWPADAIRLDAYDSPAGAGPFYARCGYRHVGNNVYRGNPLAYYELLLQ